MSLAPSRQETGTGGYRGGQARRRMARESCAGMTRGAARMEVNEVLGSRYLLLDHWLASYR